MKATEPEPEPADLASSDSDNKAKPKKKKKRKVVQRWNKDQSDYTHFTVLKKGLSTQEMLDQLARRTGNLPIRFAYCGSKDKRAITLQRVSAWRVDSKALDKLKLSPPPEEEGPPARLFLPLSPSSPHKPLLSIRDLSLATEPLRLGDLSGNHFVITLKQREQERDQNPIIEDRTSESSLETERETDGRDLVHAQAQESRSPHEFLLSQLEGWRMRGDEDGAGSSSFFLNLFGTSFLNLFVL